MKSKRKIIEKQNSRFKNSKKEDGGKIVREALKKLNELGLMYGENSMRS